MPYQQEQKPPFMFGPWAKGLTNSVDEYFVPPDGLVTANNVDIDRAGRIEARKKWDLLDSAHYKSLFEHNGQTYGVRGSDVGVIEQDNFTSITTVAGPVDWTVLDGKLVYTDFSVNKLVNGFTVEDLPTGYYDGDEQERYQFQSLPAGSAIRAWNGVLVVARGRVLYFSEPLWYGVYSAVRGFYRFGEPIRWFEAISYKNTGGLFVGLTSSVVFLEGTDNTSFKRFTVGLHSAPGVSGILDPRHSGEGTPVALWLSDVGVAVGKPDGSVSYPQADRLKDIPLTPGKMSVQDDRVFITTTAEF